MAYIKTEDGIQIALNAVRDGRNVLRALEEAQFFAEKAHEAALGAMQKIADAVKKHAKAGNRERAEFLKAKARFLAPVVNFEPEEFYGYYRYEYAAGLSTEDIMELRANGVPVGADIEVPA